MQLVELQRSVVDEPGDDVAVYAISYDPTEVLARFAEGHGIRFPLLADRGSRVITELGMLNQTIEQDQAAVGKPFGARHQGLPYPGTFLLDEAGYIVAKHFERGHRNRPSGRTLLGSLLGSLPPDAAGLAQAEFPGGSLAGWVDTTTVQPNQVQDAHVRLRLDPDFHVYTGPVPEGFTALDLRIGGDDRIQTRPPAIPAGRPFRLNGLDEEFRVLEGEVGISRPFLVFSPEADVSAQPAEVPLVLEVVLQTCTTSLCHPPVSIGLEIQLELVGETAG